MEILENLWWKMGKSAAATPRRIKSKPTACDLSGCTFDFSIDACRTYILSIFISFFRNTPDQD